MVCKYFRFPGFPRLRYCPAMNSGSPEELWSIAMILFIRISCISLGKIDDDEIPPCSPGLRAEVVASCLAGVWCHPCCTESKKGEN